MHLAASLSVNESSLFPNKYFDNNVLGTISLMKACINTTVRNIIFSSTSAVYGISKKNKSKLIEDDIKDPISNYAKSKLICEDIIKYYCKNFNINFSILRYFNVAGADLTYKTGCLNNIGQLFKNISKNIVKGVKKIEIYGNNYNTKDGTCVRDYIHVKDISLIHIKSLKYLNKQKKNLELNCGYGKGFSVYEIVREFEKVINQKIKKIIKKRRKGDVDSAICNTSKLRKTLKFNPKYNLISEIVRDSIEWEKYCLKKK